MIFYYILQIYFLLLYFLMIINLTFRILYILDLIISFFRGSYNFEYKLTKQYSLLIKNYLLGDFFFDFLEAIPIFSINKYICYNNKKNLECYKYNMPSSFYFLQIASINKILKIIKILGIKKNQVLDNFLECISENYTIERTTLLMMDSLLFIGIFHCLICYYIFIGQHTYPNWIVKTNAENESFFDIYIESFYFLVTTITTVGYGDITCSSFGERIFHILLLAIGSIFYSYIISTIGNYIKNDSNAKIKYNNDLSILENIRIAYSDMPFKLYKNIRRYLESKSSSQEKYDINSLIDGLPFTLKNNILFTMYKTVINNFKFFKKNDNSEFIAQVLTNFILVISKKNEFLVYEGEMLDEIIFVKDGRISLNAAIDVDEPIKSINTYFNEKFSPFTSDEEKKVYESRLNDCFKSGFVSTMNAEISYNAALSKINNAFKAFKSNNTEEKSAFAINNCITIGNNNEEKKNIKELGKFDINGGAIKNDDGSYQYLKILDIRKNEHFGLVFMTLKKPAPLSLQVKSKFAELYYLKKKVAVSISKDYPNIWKKLYGKEFHNLTSIKTRTFKALSKYMELNQLLIELNIDDGIGRNDITVNYLNELEKSLYNDKSIFSHNSRKNISLKRGYTYNNNLTKFKTFNSESEKKKRLSAGKLFLDNPKEKLSKRSVYKGKRFSNSIIYNNLNRENILQFSNKYLNVSSKKVKQPKSVHFNDENIYNKDSNKNDVLLNKQLMKKMSSSEICAAEDNDSGKKMTYFKKNSKKERYSRLKQFLINLQKKLKIKYYEEKNNKPRNNSLKDSNNANKIRKGILKRKQFSLMTEKKNKNGELNINNNEDSNEALINEIKNFFKEEVDLSLYSINDEKCFNLDELCIINDINLEIISSYSNLNQLSKGKFIKDKEVQKKIRLSMKHFYSNKSNNKVKISNPSINIFTNSEENVIRIKKKKTQKSQKKNLESPQKKSPVSHKKLRNKQKILENEKLSQKNINLVKEFEMQTQNKKSKKSLNNKNINNKLNLLKVNNPNSNISTNNDLIMNSNNNLSNNIISNNIISKNISNNFTFQYEPTEQNSVKVNISDDNIKCNSSSKKITNPKTKQKEIQNLCKDQNPIVNIKKNKHIYDNSEVEYEINKTFTKPNSLFFGNNSINEIDKDDINYKNSCIIKKESNNKGKYKNKKNGNKIINQILGINLPEANIITNNITTISSNNNNNDNFNTNEKINNIEASFSIYNIIQKNINKNLNIIDNKEKIEDKKITQNYCIIF